MRKLKTKDLPIQRRLTLSYMALIFLIVLLIILGILAIFFSYMHENSRQQLSLKLENLSDHLVSELESVVHIGKSMTGDEYVMDILEELTEEDISGYLQQEYISQQISPLIAKIIVSNSELMLLDPIHTRNVYQDAILMDEDFLEFLQTDQQVLLSRPGIFPIGKGAVSSDESLSVVCYQRLFDAHDLLKGYLLAVLDKQYLFSTIWEQTLGSEFAGTALFDQHNRCVYDEGIGFTSEELGVDFSSGIKSHSFLKRIDGELFLSFTQPVSGFNWSIAAIVPYSTLFQRLILAVILIIAIGLLAIIVSFAVSSVISRKITDPLTNITAAMHRYDDLQVLEQIEVEADGELSYLVEVYNRMVRSVNESIASMYDEQEKKNQAELLSLQYEMDFLQAQINPHFIHNTLNAVGYQAQKLGDTQIYNSLKAFNRLLRASLSGTRETIPLSEEIDLVDSFVEIQRLRYGESFHIEYHIDERLLSLFVPKLMLQPVVENAIFYGEEKEGQTKILIETFTRDEVLTIIVTDNGPGMDADLLTNSRTDVQGRKFNRVGLLNIEERLHMLFGEGYGIEISSSIGEGTRISIRIPEVDSWM